MTFEAVQYKIKTLDVNYQKPYKNGGFHLNCVRGFYFTKGFICAVSMFVLSHR